MRAMDIVRGTVKKVADHLAAMRSREEFTCGDCERWERCGLSPTDTCVIRAAQLARYDRRRPNRYLLSRMVVPRW